MAGYRDRALQYVGKSKHAKLRPVECQCDLCDRETLRFGNYIHVVDVETGAIHISQDCWAYWRKYHEFYPQEKWVST